MASSCVQTFKKLKGNMRRILMAVTADASGGSVDNVDTEKNIDGEVLFVVTDPGATVPTNDYDITLADSQGCDILGSEGDNRSSTTTQQAMLKIGNHYGPRYVEGPLTLGISGNSVNSALINVYIYFRRVRKK